MRQSYVIFPPDVPEGRSEDEGITVNDEGPITYMPLDRAVVVIPQNVWDLKSSPAVHIGVLQNSRIVNDGAGSRAMALGRYRVSILPGAVNFSFSFLSRLSSRPCRQIDTLVVCVDEYLVANWHGRVEAWQRAASNVLEHAKPGALSLQLSWDVDTALNAEADLDMAMAIVKPLLDTRPGTLRDCSIRLSAERDYRLAKLAMEVSCHATGKYHKTRHCAAPFRFFDLPLEIRLSILAYTDLVTPFSEVCWHPARGFYCSFLCTQCEYWCHRAASGQQPDPLGDRQHWGCLFRFCGLLSPPSSDGNLFCRVRHGAYTTSCQCWETPQDLMLVSRAFYSEAASVFYSRNRITIVNDCRPRNTHLCSLDPLRLDVSRFLTRSMWPETTLGHIKTLEVVFPRFRDTSRPDSKRDHVYYDWLFAIEHLVKHANLANLTLIVHMSSFKATTLDTEERLLSYQQMLSGVRKMSQPSPIARRLLEPLGVALKDRIKHFQAHFEASWHCSLNCRENSCQAPVQPIDVDQRSVCRNLRERESQLDKIVMGYPYNRRLAVEGDEPVYIPQWLQKCTNYIYPRR